MPVFGPLLQKTAISRLTRTLSSLFSSAVPILQAITISERVAATQSLVKVMIQARESLEKGNTLTEPLEKSWLFPPLVTSMTQLGNQQVRSITCLKRLRIFMRKKSIVQWIH